MSKFTENLKYFEKNINWKTLSAHVADMKVADLQQKKPLEADFQIPKTERIFEEDRFESTLYPFTHPEHCELLPEILAESCEKMLPSQCRHMLRLTRKKERELFRLFKKDIRQKNYDLAEQWLRMLLEMLTSLYVLSEVLSWFGSVLFSEDASEDFDKFLDKHPSICKYLISMSDAYQDCATLCLESAAKLWGKLKEVLGFETSIKLEYSSYSGFYGRCFTHISNLLDSAEETIEQIFLTGMEKRREYEQTDRYLEQTALR